MMKRVLLCLLLTAVGMMAQAQEGDRVFYSRPGGAYYLGLQGWSPNPIGTTLIVKPWTQVTFKNGCTDRAGAQWKDYMGNDNYTVDANNDFSLETVPTVIKDGYWYYERVMPTITAGGVSYTLGQDSRFWDADYGSTIATTSEPMPMSLVDCSRKLAASSDGTMQYNIFISSPQDRYVYGTASVTVTEGTSTKTYYQQGVLQLFEKPMSALYIDKVTVPAFSFSKNKIAAGALTLTFYEVELKSDGIKRKGEMIYQMKCDAAESIDRSSSVHGTFDRFVLIFNRKQATDQIVLTDEFFVEIDGFSDEGMDIGLAAAYIDPIDKEAVSGGLVTLRDANKQKTNLAYSLNAEVVPVMSLYGVYDHVIVGNSRVTVPTAGGNVNTTVYTCMNWNAAGSEPNYTIEGLPDWLSVSVDDSKHDFYSFVNEGQWSLGNGANTLTFTAQPLPANEEGRAATLVVKGKGVSGTMTVVQGNVEAGVHGITTDEFLSNMPVYDLSGRRAGKNAKGILIQGGKKVLR